MLFYRGVSVGMGIFECLLGEFSLNVFICILFSILSSSINAVSSSISTSLISDVRR